MTVLTGKYMMVLLVVATLICVGGMPVAAENKVNITLRVRPTTSRDKSVTDQDKETKNGEDRSTVTEIETEVCTLEVSIRQDGAPVATCQLEWYFISDNVKNVQDRRIPTVFDAGKKNLQLKESVVQNETLVSNKFEMKRITQSYDRNKDDVLQGNSYKGYVVLVTSNGEILAKASNSTRFLKGNWMEMYKSAGAQL